MSRFPPDYFAENLKRLIGQRGQTLKALSLELGETDEERETAYRWLRRVSTKGIRQLDKRTTERVEKLAVVLGVASVGKLLRPETQTVDDVSTDEVIACMERHHPREWALFKAVHWQDWQTVLEQEKQERGKWLVLETFCRQFANLIDQRWELQEREPPERPQPKHVQQPVREPEPEPETPQQPEREPSEWHRLLRNRQRTQPEPEKPKPRRRLRR